MTSVSSFFYDSCVRGHHIYKDIWTPTINEELQCRREPGNIQDLHAVAIVKDSAVVVGHVPRKISTLCSSFIRRGGFIVCKVIGERRYSHDLIQGGLEVPCRLAFTTHNDNEIKKIKKLLPVVDGIKPATSCDKVSRCSTACLDEPAAKIPGLNETAQVWVECGRIILTLADKDAITQNQQLQDIHMTFGQHLLKKQFLHISGLTNTLTIVNQAPYSVTDPVIQIFFTRNCHWLVASNIFSSDNEVVVYDSLFTDVSKNTHHAITHLFNRPTISVVQPQKQNGTVDCGLFALAFATSLAYGHDPLLINYNQDAMRDHITKCFENKKLVAFN